jgi:hypothetical protein
MAGHGWWFPQEVVFASARVKNSENQREYRNIIDAIIELTERRVDTSMRTPWDWSLSILSRSGQVVALARGGFYLIDSQKLRKANRIL